MYITDDPPCWIWIRIWEASESTFALVPAKYTPILTVESCGLRFLYFPNDSRNTKLTKNYVCHIFGIDLTGRDSSVSEIGIVSDNGVYWLCEKNRCSWNITVKPMYLLFNTVSVIQNATQNIFPTISTCSRLQKHVYRLVHSVSRIP